MTELYRPETINAGILWGAFILLLLYRLTFRVLRFSYSRTSFFFLKHVIYPYLWRYGKITRIRSLFTIIYLIINMLFASIPVSSKADISKRTGLLSIVNMVPLFAGYNTVLTDYLDMSVKTQHQLHLCMGAVTFCHGAVHAILRYLASEGPPQPTSVGWPGISVSY